MKLVIEQGALAALLDGVSSLTLRGNIVPIYGHVLLAAKKTRLTATCANGEQWISGYTHIKDGTEGSACVPATPLKGFVSALPKGAEIALELNQENNRLNIRCGRTSAHMATLPADDFPAFNPDKGETAAEFEIEPAALGKLLSRVQDAAPKDDKAFFWRTGIHLFTKPKTLVAEASSSAAIFRQTMKAPAKVDFNIILPAETVGAMLRILAEAPEDKQASLVIEPGAWMKMQCGRWFISSRLVDATYGDLDPIIPTEHEMTCEADTAAFSEAIRPLLVLVDTQYHGMKMVFNGSISLTSGTGLGGSDTTIDARIKGPEVKWSVDYRIFSKALEMAGAQINIAMSPNRPVALITTPDDPEWLAVVAGLRF